MTPLGYTLWIDGPKQLVRQARRVHALWVDEVAPRL